MLPHGHCISWNDYLVWSLLLSNGVIAASYVSIPITLIYIYVRAKFRGDFSGSKFFIFGFSAFIVLCGITHLWDIITMYSPLWYIDSYVRIATALASVYVALQLPKFAQKHINRPTREEYLEMERRVKEAEANLATMILNHS